MLDTNALSQRIDAQFAELEEKFKKSTTEQLQQHREHENRVQQLNRVFDQLRDIWKPRLDLLVAKFGDRIQVMPRLTPSSREVTFEFKSPLAHVTLRFTAVTDRNVTQVILNYDLRIIPILMEFENHSQLALPLDRIDADAVGQWIDDRIVNFVKTYLSLHENEYYLKAIMVEDPIALVRFPKFAAGATLEWQGKTFYFLGEETRAEYSKQQGIASR